MEFRFDDLNWGEFGVHVLKLLFESVNHKKKLSVHISFCVMTFCLSLVTKCLDLKKENFCPFMERKLCDVCIWSLFLLWYKFINFSEKHATSRFRQEMETSGSMKCR